MNQHYQLTIYRDNKLLGHFQANTMLSLEKIKIMFHYLQPYPDLTFELHQVTEEARFLVQKQGSLHVLGTEQHYQLCPIEQLTTKPVEDHAT